MENFLPQIKCIFAENSHRLDAKNVHKYRQLERRSWCSMQLVVGTCAVFFMTRAMIGRNITNHSLEKKKAPCFDL